MKKPVYTLTLTYDELAVLSRELHMRINTLQRDAELFIDHPRLAELYREDAEDCENLLDLIDNAATRPTSE